MILSSHKIAYAPSQGDVVTVSTTSKNIKPGFRMLAFKSWGGKVHSKTLEIFLLSSKSYFINIFELTHKIKTAQKVVLNFFQINLKIN